VDSGEFLPSYSPHKPYNNVLHEFWHFVDNKSDNKSNRGARAPPWPTATSKDGLVHDDEEIRRDTGHARELATTPDHTRRR
jgi:hypothetical protein